MKRHMYAFMGIFSFLTMIIAPVITIVYFPHLILYEIVLSLMNAIAFSAIIVDIIIGAVSVMLTMKEVYKDSVRHMYTWLIIAFVVSVCQYLFFALYHISTL